MIGEILSSCMCCYYLLKKRCSTS